MKAVFPAISAKNEIISLLESSKAKKVRIPATDRNSLQCKVKADPIPKHFSSTRSVLPESAFKHSELFEP
jgi:hypothetical protein